MMRLSREVRFAITPNYDSTISNSWSGWPSTDVLAPRLSIITTVEGQPEEQSGYICNIKIIDDLIRKVITEDVIPQFSPNQTAEQILKKIFDCSQNQWNVSNVRLMDQRLQVTPFLSYQIHSENESMVALTQQFEFSASHRLHNESLSEAQNQELFGKCNNLNGHGHNYVVEVSVKRPVHSEAAVSLPEFESQVKKLVIDRLDHKHLNLDVEYFATVNPSVENIAIAIWHWLNGNLGSDHLSNVRVYETPKTWADYSG